MKPFDYDEGEIHRRYDRARNFSGATLRLWMERLAAHVPPAEVKSVVDLGCGTGRFTVALAETFAASVHGVDPSAKMLKVARANVSGSPASARITLTRGSAEDIPLEDESADLVFLSMVYHHLRDKPRACAEFRRVLKQSGRLAVRTATREGLDAYEWLSFFPEALEIEAGRNPSKEELVAVVESGGFKLAAHEVVRQLFAKDYVEYVEKISLRGVSSLEAIPDGAFRDGLARLRRHCEAQGAAGPVYEDVDLFVFTVA